TTLQGGDFGYGTVFEVVAGSSTITTLASFDYSNGANPYAGLIMDGSGNLFGTTNQGGALGYGAVFEVAAGSGAITTLGSFDYYTNGAYPAFGGHLFQDADGNLFGTAISGGPGGNGTVFEVALAGNSITVTSTVTITDPPVV